MNRPFGLAMAGAWEEKYGQKLEMFAGNEAVVFQLPHAVSAEELLSLVNTSNVESVLRRTLESSGFFGARFREAAGIALAYLLGYQERRPESRTDRILGAASGVATAGVLLWAAASGIYLRLHGG